MLKEEDKIDSIKEEYDNFRNQLENKIKNMRDISMRNKECYIIKESWISDFISSFTIYKKNKGLRRRFVNRSPLPNKKPEILNDISSFINILKEKNKFCLINKELIEYAFQDNQNELINNSLIKYHAGKNKIIIEYNSSSEIALLLNDPLGKNIYKQAFIIINNNERAKIKRYEKILNEFRLDLKYNQEYNNFIKTIEEYIKNKNEQKLNDRISNIENSSNFYSNKYLKQRFHNQENKEVKEGKDENLTEIKNRLVSSPNILKIIDQPKNINERSISFNYRVSKNDKTINPNKQTISYKNENGKIDTKKYIKRLHRPSLKDIDNKKETDKNNEIKEIREEENYLEEQKNSENNNEDIYSSNEILSTSKKLNKIIKEEENNLELKNNKNGNKKELIEQELNNLKSKENNNILFITGEGIKTDINSKEQIKKFELKKINSEFQTEDNEIKRDLIKEEINENINIENDGIKIDNISKENTIKTQIIKLKEYTVFPLIIFMLPINM